MVFFFCYIFDSDTVVNDVCKRQNMMKFDNFEYFEKTRSLHHSKEQYGRCTIQLNDLAQGFLVVFFHFVYRKFSLKRWEAGFLENQTSGFSALRTRGKCLF